ncbi:MAG: ABC transporter permease [Actinomycetes bacterium]
MTTLDFAPSGGPAPAARMLVAQTAMEVRLTLRRGESLLLVALIPVVLLVGFSTMHVVDITGSRVDFVVPGILALAVMSTAFTGQAIATGFERQYGVLKLLGATPLPRWVLLVAKTLGVLLVEMLQVALVVAVGFALGWHPHGNAAAVVALLVLGTAAFSGLGLLMAGTLRAEATLAAANLVYVVLLLVGGVLFPLSKYPAGARHLFEALPIAALSQGLRDVLRSGVDAPTHDWIVLVVWALAALVAAAFTFRWE